MPAMAAKWDLNRRLRALQHRPLDRETLNSQPRAKQSILILNWAKCIGADGKSLFAIARVPHLGGGSSIEELRSKASKRWVEQQHSVKEYFIKCSAQIIGGDLSALWEVLDLYGELDVKGSLPAPEQLRKRNQSAQRLHLPAPPLATRESNSTSKKRNGSQNPLPTAGVSTPLRRSARLAESAASGMRPQSPATSASKSQQLSPSINLRPSRSVPSISTSPKIIASNPLRKSTRLAQGAGSQTSTPSAASGQPKTNNRAIRAGPQEPRRSAMTESEATEVTSHEQHSPPDAVKLRDDQIKWNMSLARRLEYFDIAPFDASMLLSLDVAARDQHVLQWCIDDLKISGKVLLGLRSIPVFAALPDTHRGSLKQWLECQWGNTTAQDRQSLDAFAHKIRYSRTGAAANFVEVIALQFGLYVACTTFYGCVTFPAPEKRHPNHKTLELESIFNDPVAQKLNRVYNCFEGEDRGLFYFHTFPIICEEQSTDASDPKVVVLADVIWGQLQEDEISKWKEGLWWLMGQLKRGNPMSVVKLLPWKPLEGSRDFNEIAESQVAKYAKDLPARGHIMHNGQSEPEAACLLVSSETQLASQDNTTLSTTKDSTTDPSTEAPSSIAEFTTDPSPEAPSSVAGSTTESSSPSSEDPAGSEPSSSPSEYIEKHVPEQSPEKTEVVTGSPSPDVESPCDSCTQEKRATSVEQVATSVWDMAQYKQVLDKVRPVSREKEAETISLLLDAVRMRCMQAGAVLNMEDELRVKLWFALQGPQTSPQIYEKRLENCLRSVEARINDSHVGQNNV